MAAPASPAEDPISHMNPSTQPAGAAVRPDSSTHAPQSPAPGATATGTATGTGAPR